MNRHILIAVVAALAFVTAGACGGRPQESRGADGSGTPSGPTAFDEYDGQPNPAPPDPGLPAPPSVPAPSPHTWLPEGTRLDNAAAGFGGVIADTSTIRLTNGSWRMFVYAGGQYRSASSPDGLSFAMDAGTRLPEGLGHIRVLRLPDGRIRAFSQTGDGIVSSISTDEGMTFTREPGVRVASAAIGFTPSGVSMARMRDGTWRMYFSSLPRPGEGPLAHKVLSAASADLLTWVVDAGVRLGPGSTLEGAAEHPAAMANADGSVSLFYFRNSNFKMLMATAGDGLTFSSEFDTGLSTANDPDVIALPDGSVRMYYNWGDNAGGAVYSALYIGAPFAPAVFGNGIVDLFQPPSRP